MEKREGDIGNRNISSLNQLVKTLEIYIKRFEEAYQRKDYHEFNLLKKEILNIQKKISEFIT